MPSRTFTSACSALPVRPFPRTACHKINAGLQATGATCPLLNHDMSDM